MSVLEGLGLLIQFWNLVQKADLTNFESNSNF